jgi:hypothetical protein
MFPLSETNKVSFTTQGNAVAVKVLAVPTGWTVIRTGTVNAGTFTVTAPAIGSVGDAIVLISDAAGNTVIRTLELATVTFPTTLALCAFAPMRPFRRRMPPRIPDTPAGKGVCNTPLHRWLFDVLVYTLFLSFVISFVHLWREGNGRNTKCVVFGRFQLVLFGIR